MSRWGSERRLAGDYFGEAVGRNCASHRRPPRPSRPLLCARAEAAPGNLTERLDDLGNYKSMIDALRVTLQS